MIGSAPEKKIVHRAAHEREGGAVSALCYARPRAINTRTACWTTDDSEVTCRVCQLLIEKMPPPLPAAQEISA